MDYTILQNDFLPVELQDKPRWMICVVCAVGLLVVTLSAVSVGAFIGYTYCYVEHRRGFRTGDTTYATKVKVMEMPSKYDENDPKTINSVLFTSVLVSRLVQFGQTLKDDITHLHTTDLKKSSYSQRSKLNTPEFL